MTGQLSLVTHLGHREVKDRLELLETLIAAPNFDPMFRSDVIAIPKDHPVLGWGCRVDGCERPANSNKALCGSHNAQWLRANTDGTEFSSFLRSASPLITKVPATPQPCILCGDARSAISSALMLCKGHRHRWEAVRRRHPSTDYDDWLLGQEPYPPAEECVVPSCPDKAASRQGLCHFHIGNYYKAGKPADRPGLQTVSRKTPEQNLDPAAFKIWCEAQLPAPRAGRINLLGLPPLLKAELKWGIQTHVLDKEHTRWGPTWMQLLINQHRTLKSITELDLEQCTHSTRMIAIEVLNALRIVMTTKTDTRKAGYIELDQFGTRFRNRQSQYQLTGVHQPWLRNLLWDYIADQLSSPDGARSAGPYDSMRRSITELSAYLKIHTPDAGHSPGLLTPQHVQDFIADQKHRAQAGLPALGRRLHTGEPVSVTANTLRFTTMLCRKLMRWALENGHTTELNLSREFVVAFPLAGKGVHRSRNPFTDETAAALADATNLAMLDTKFDPNDRGLRDIWETIIVTGRRASEVIELRFECVGRYRGLPFLWHDQTKVGKYNEGVRIPEYTFERLLTRQQRTLEQFELKFRRPPSAQERQQIALFPTNIRNPQFTRSVSYHWFQWAFKEWVEELNLEGNVAHQARHTLATKLLAAGAQMHHVKAFLGHVSTTMTERYARVALSEIEDVLQNVWVTGPGSDSPGEILTPTVAEPMSRSQAQEIAIDLARRSTPAEGGFCTFQPVVDGNACPWNLNCHSCDNFVISGADLIYWRRKREQWNALAERAPDSATADFLHQAFQPTSKAIDGLEKALAAIGLLDEALALDLRRPQDYFHRLWRTAFRPGDLTDQPANEPEGPDDLP